MQAKPPTPITIQSLVERYDALLFDAYGVLVDKSCPLPGAIDLIAHLNHAGKPYFVLTNSASRLPEGMASAFAALGLAIPSERYITSGSLLAPYFIQHQLQGKRCLVLGPEDSAEYVRLAGGEPCRGADCERAEVVVLADQAGFPLLEGMDAALSLILQRVDAEEPVHLILCNPDLIYPVSPGHFGFTSGALAAMLEAVLLERYGEGAPRFARLGKPHPPLFEEAVRRAGSRNLVMIGDQLATDILGANRFGVDAVLVTTGLAQAQVMHSADAHPDFILKSLAF